MFPSLHTIFLWVSDQMGKAGYPVLFGILVSCGLGIPVPEDIPLLLAGYFVADGRMSLIPAAICAWCGIIGGDCILYALGRRFGPNISKLPLIGSHVDQEKMKWAHERFEKYGIWMVAVGRMFAVIRGIMVITAGTIKFTFSHFFLADGIAAIFSGGLFMALGYYGRKRLGDPEQIAHEIESSMRLVLAGVLAAILVFAAWKWWQNRQRKKQKQAIIQHAKHREAAASND